MPTRIGERIATALTDRKVTADEAKTIIDTAKAERKFTPELKAEIQALLAGSNTTFEGTSKADLQKFLDGTPALKDLADPKVLSKDATAVSFFPVQGGTLFVDGMNYDDVAQGYIGDCYFSSATTSVAEMNPQAIKDAIKDNGDGTYTVRFFQRSFMGTAKPVTVVVDGDLPSKTAGGTEYYQHGRNRTELWPALLEKAYAQWKGGYDAIGNGGDAGSVMTAITGKPSTSFSNSSLTADQIFAKLKTATSSSHPVAAGTFGESQEAMYTNTGVHANHAYTVLGVSEEGGKKYVQLRNPWGFSEPTPGDGKDDGIFKLPIADFKKLYSNTMIGG